MILQLKKKRSKQEFTSNRYLCTNLNSQELRLTEPYLWKSFMIFLKYLIWKKSLDLKLAIVGNFHIMFVNEWEKCTMTVPKMYKLKILKLFEIWLKIRKKFLSSDKEQWISSALCYHLISLSLFTSNEPCF